MFTLDQSNIRQQPERFLESPSLPSAPRGRRDYRDVVIECLSDETLALENCVVDLTADRDAQREVLRRALAVLATVLAERDQALCDLRRLRRQGFLARHAEGVA